MSLSVSDSLVPFYEIDGAAQRPQQAPSVTLLLSTPSSNPGRLQDDRLKQGLQMKLYVGNLSYNTTDSTLNDLFAPYGQVESARVITDRDTGSSKGFGFVEMSNSDAQKAMGALNGREIDGRAIRVNEAKPQESRTGGGGGGRGRLLVLPEISGYRAVGGGPGQSGPRSISGGLAETLHGNPRLDPPRRRPRLRRPLVLPSAAASATPTGKAKADKKATVGARRRQGHPAHARRETLSRRTACPARIRSSPYVILRSDAFFLSYASPSPSPSATSQRRSASSNSPRSLLRAMPRSRNRSPSSSFVNRRPRSFRATSR